MTSTSTNKTWRVNEQTEEPSTRRAGWSHNWQSRWSHEVGRKPLRAVPCSWQATSRPQGVIEPRHLRWATGLMMSIRYRVQESGGQGGRARPSRPAGSPCKRPAAPYQSGMKTNNAVGVLRPTQQFTIIIGGPTPPAGIPRRLCPRHHGRHPQPAHDTTDWTTRRVCPLHRKMGRWRGNASRRHDRIGNISPQVAARASTRDAGPTHTGRRIVGLALSVSPRHAIARPIAMPGPSAGVAGRAPAI